MNTDQNDLAYWYPRIQAAGLPVPATMVVHTDLNLLALLDGPVSDGPTADEFSDFLIELLGAADVVRYGMGPFFLRTGHTSGKHSWDRTCYVRSHHSLGDHVYALVEYSAMADLVGLPVQTWAVRALIPNVPLFTMVAYGGMPWVPEWRFFVRDGTVEHVQPYWPHDAIAQGDPDAPNWREIVAATEDKLGRDAAVRQLGYLAQEACAAVGGGYWSVDLLWSAVTGHWYLTDMALGDVSYRYEP